MVYLTPGRNLGQDLVRRRLRKMGWTERQAAWAESERLTRLKFGSTRQNLDSKNSTRSSMRTDRRQFNLGFTTLHYWVSE